MDTVDKATRSRIMSSIRGTNTKPELQLRQALTGLGVSYRVHNRRLPGTPDISHTGRRLAVFIDGCLWHGCPLHYKRPASRQEFWDGKLAYNHDLRRRVTAKLKDRGFEVVQVWECAVRKDAGQVALRLKPYWAPTPAGNAAAT